MDNSFVYIVLKSFFIIAFLVLVLAVLVLWFQQVIRNREKCGYKLFFPQTGNIIDMGEVTWLKAKRHARKQYKQCSKIKLLKVYDQGDFRVNFSRADEATLVWNNFIHLWCIFKIPKISKESSSKKLLKETYIRTHKLPGDVFK